MVYFVSLYYLFALELWRFYLAPENKVIILFDIDQLAEHDTDIGLI